MRTIELKLKFCKRKNLLLNLLENKVVDKNVYEQRLIPKNRRGTSKTSEGTLGTKTASK